MAENETGTETDAIARDRDRHDTTVVEIAALEAGAAADDVTTVVIDITESETLVATIVRTVVADATAPEVGAVMTETSMTVDEAAPEVGVVTTETDMTVDAITPEAGAIMAAELGMPAPAETEKTETSLPLAGVRTTRV